MASNDRVSDAFFALTEELRPHIEQGRNMQAVVDFLSDAYLAYLAETDQPVNEWSDSFIVDLIDDVLDDMAAEGRTLRRL